MIVNERNPDGTPGRVQQIRPVLTLAGWKQLFQPQLDDLARMIRAQLHVIDGKFSTGRR